MNETQKMVEFLLEEIQPSEKIIETGLTRDEAMKKFPYKSSMGDKRGFSYEPKTGKAVWI